MNSTFSKGLETLLTDGQLKKLASQCVGIAGAGGLGSNIACHLVRSGIRRLVVADFDEVAPSNLNRQFYFLDQLGMPKVDALKVNLQRINPDLVMQTENIRLDAANIRSIFKDCSVVVEAMDGAAGKKMMAECFMTDPRLFVSASGVGGWGRSERIKSRRVSKTFYLIGDGESEVSPTVPPMSPIVGIAAAKQADAVIEWILGQCPLGAAQQ